MDYYLSQKFGLDWARYPSGRINAIIAVMKEEEKLKEANTKKQEFFSHYKNGN